MNPYNASFQKALAGLNDNQLKAVKHLDGPVLALAGPGTGKTQLLSVRIGYILTETDTLPSNILALTYTDAGATAMRNRLLEIIGPSAHQIEIGTFHSFCNKIIRLNPELFNDLSSLDPADDLQRKQIAQEIIDDLPSNHPLKRLKTDPYLEAKNMLDLWAKMKQEGWDAQNMETALDEAKQRMRGLDDMIYKVSRKGQYEKGQFKQRIFDEEVSKFEKTKAAAHLLDTYKAKMAERGLMDFADMINWVNHVFEHNDDLLLDYQEQYHHILVDEYQDTNGSQNKIVYALADYWDRPNLFVVGDDDQAIYSFQGADIGNIQAFQKKYLPEVIILDKNYRSTQQILDAAARVIDHNEQRLSTKLKIDKNIKAAREHKPAQGPAPMVQTYENEDSEGIGVLREIITLHEQGVPYNDFAILYKKHAHTSKLIRFCSEQNIPTQVKRKINILEEIDCIRIMKLMTYIQLEARKMYAGSQLLFEILHQDYFNIRPRDLGVISIHTKNYYSDKEDHDTNDTGMYWRDAIGSADFLDKIGVVQSEPILAASALLEAWIHAYHNMTPQVLLQKVVTEGGLLDDILASPNRNMRLQILNTLFEHLKAMSANQPKIKLEDWLDHLRQLDEDPDLKLEINITFGSANGIFFSTYHGSKGLEFPRVYMLHSTADVWKAESRKGYRIPQYFYHGNTLKEKEDTTEEQRRLFFVGMTRAEDYLTITYPEANVNGKPQTVAAFVSEALPDISEHQHITVVEADLVAFSAAQLRFEQSKPQLIDHDLIDRVLTNFKLSSTNLNKYLRCPTTFYFESILKVPGARLATNGYGNAVHQALERYFNHMKAHQYQLPGESLLMESFEEGMHRFRSHFTDLEYQNHLEHGRLYLPAYLESRKPVWRKISSLVSEYKIESSHYDGVPLSGMLDLVAEIDGVLHVFDFKTGNPKNAGKKVKGPQDDEDLGGDYWRQMIFYKIMLREDATYKQKLKTDSMVGYMDMTEALDDHYPQYLIDIDDWEEQRVGDQIKDTWERIHRHEFENGCKEPTCTWCRFVANNHMEAEQ